MKTIALLATATDRIELVDAIVPEPDSGEVLVEALYTAISPGTELRCLAGNQHGFRFPFIPGYSMVGRIVRRGAGVALTEGTVVFCHGTEKADLPLGWGAHIGHAVRRAASVFPLPAGMDPIEAALAKLAAIAYRGVDVAGTLPHDQVAIVGLGLIGQLAARLHALTGARVVAADTRLERVELARAAGIEAVVPQNGLAAAFAELQPEGADVVVDSTGAPSVLPQSVLLAKSKPFDDSLTEPTRLLVQGSYVADVKFDYHEAFCRELAVYFPRDQRSRDLRTVLRLMAQGRLKTRDLVSRLCPPQDAQEVFSALRAADPGLLTAVFRWK